MGFFAKWRVNKQVTAHGKVEVSEQRGVRTLHLGSETVQSVMRVNDPTALEASYTRSMMAFLLFHPAPRDILQVGLGGGSIAKWLHHHLPEAHDRIVEIHPEVITTARSYFHLPPDDDRLQVEVGEGAAFVEAHPQAADVLLVDGYDVDRQAASLGTQEFYDACRRALKPGGIFVVNLWGTDSSYPVFVDRISTAFDGLFLLLPADGRHNIIAFGFERTQNEPKWEDLRARARALEEKYGLEFLHFVQGLKRLNVHTERRLLV